MQSLWSPLHRCQMHGLCQVVEGLKANRPPPAGILGNKIFRGRKETGVRKGDRKGVDEVESQLHMGSVYYGLLSYIGSLSLMANRVQVFRATQSQRERTQNVANRSQPLLLRPNQSLNLEDNGDKMYWSLNNNIISTYLRGASWFSGSGCV